MAGEAKERLSIELIARDRLSSVMKRAGANVAAFSKKAGASLLALATGPVVRLIAAFSGFAAIAGATTQAREFSLAMTEVQTIAGATAPELERLRQGVLDLAVANGENEKILGKGLYQTISSGITDASDALVVMEASQRLAIAGLAETSQAGDLVTSALNAPIG